MKRFFVTALLAAAATLWAGSLARANILVGADYHLGESDPGAANGLAGDSTTVDSSTFGITLTKTGTETYTSSVASSASLHTGSSLAMSFNGTGYYSELGTCPDNGVGNFAIEGWFKTTNGATQQCLAYNGDTWQNGWGLYDIGGTLYGLYGGVAALNSGIAVPSNQWFYAALVNVAGDAKVYYNNGGATQVVDLGSASTPTTPGAVSEFIIGAAGGVKTTGGTAYQDYLNGSADEVRVDAFGGSYVFNPSTDLMINATVPEPSTLVLLTMGLFGLAAYAWRKRK